MARVIQEHVKRPLAEELLFGRLERGGHVRVSLDGDALQLRFDQLADAPGEALDETI